jgi:ADP-ribose pyrophosphatase YjhB (NUDIX family)
MAERRSYRHLTPDAVRFCPLCGGPLALEPVGPDDKVEMVCPACPFIYYLDHKVVGGTIPIDDAGRILLTRRAIHPGFGKWTFPGGFVNWGEEVEAGAIRETLEETGLDVALEGLVGVYSYPGTPLVIVVYRARVLGGTITVCHENDRVEWVARDEIPWDDLAFPSTRSALKDLFDAIPPR